MDIKVLLEALSSEARDALETHFVEEFIRGVVEDLRSASHDEYREWATSVEESFVDWWGTIEGL